MPGRPWSIRQYAGFGTGEETNRRFRFLIGEGQAALSVAFDLPTQMGLDSDDPRAAGEVGRVGVAVDSASDVEAMFDGIPLDEVSTSMTINAPAAVLVAMYHVACGRQGRDPSQIRGTAQNDVLKEYVSRGTYIFPPRPSLRLAADLIAWCAREAPRFNAISLSGYHMREAGCTASQEMGVRAVKCDRLRRGGAGARGGCGQLRAPSQLDLQHPHRLLRGDRKVPGAAADVGLDHAGPVRRHRPALDDAAHAHPDGRAPR